MKNRITSGTLMAIACSAALAYAASPAAQQQQQQTPSQQQPTREPQSPQPGGGAPPGARSVGIGAEQRDSVITGCLRQGSSANSYVLTQTPGTSVPKSGVGSAGGRPVDGNRYELAGSRTDLSKLVGRQVEVTGSAVLTPGGQGSPTDSPRDGSAPIAGANDKGVQGNRTGDAVRDGDSKVGLGHESQRGSNAEAGLTRFNVKSIKQTRSSC